MTMWFETMVESAMAATITMEVAAEKPPRKAMSASSFEPAASGTVRTKRSGSSPGRIARPPIAIGSTKSEISAR